MSNCFELVSNPVSAESQSVATPDEIGPVIVDLIGFEHRGIDCIQPLDLLIDFRFQPKF